MKLARIGSFALTAGLYASLAGCTIAPKEPDFTVELEGHYQAIGDCAIVGLRAREKAWQKIDLPSQNQSELSIVLDGMEAARIVVQGTAANRTKVVSYYPQAVWGRDYWPNINRPVFEKCSRDLTSTQAAPIAAPL